MQNHIATTATIVVKEMAADEPVAHTARLSMKKVVKAMPGTMVAVKKVFFHEGASHSFSSRADVYPANMPWITKEMSIALKSEPRLAGLRNPRHAKMKTIHVQQ
jgi:hypothetical protein